jgi:hypothetical protein
VRQKVHRESGLLKFFSSFVGADERLSKEVFFLAYHLHWGYDEIVSLAIDERWVYVRLLADRLENEQDALKQAGRR